MKRVLRWMPCLVIGLLACSLLPAEGDPAPAKVERNAEALALLTKADAAIKKVSAVRMAVKTVPSGIATNFISPAEGTTLMVGWNNGLPAKFRTEVQTTKTGSGEPLNLVGGGDGESYFLIDHAAKKAYQDMDPGVLGSGGRTLQSLGMIEYVHPAPFEDELNADKVELLAGEEVAGEACHKIRVTYSGGQGESIWYFSKADYLPRRRTRMFSSPQGEGAVDAVITRLEIEPKIDPGQFKLSLPEGYQQIDDFAP